jgi:hypothetical protein
MNTTNVKRIAVAGAVSGALGFAAIGLGAGTAGADPLSDIAPMIPSDVTDEVVEYLPLIESVAEIGGDAGLGELANVPVLGDIGNLGNLPDLLAIAGGF